MQDLVAKAKSGGMSFASAGVGSATHWAAERFIVSAGLQVTHVPFRGGPEALTEVMTGRVDFIFIGISSGLPFIQNKQLVPLAVSSAKRSPALPDIPTTLEAGYRDSDFNYWNGILVPAKTPLPVVERLYVETTRALALPEVQQKLTVQGVEPAPTYAERNGRHDPPRDRAQSRDREGSRAEVQLSGRYALPQFVAHAGIARRRQKCDTHRSIPVAHRHGRSVRISLHALPQFC